MTALSALSATVHLTPKEVEVILGALDSVEAQGDDHQLCEAMKGRELAAFWRTIATAIAKLGGRSRISSPTASVEAASDVVTRYRRLLTAAASALEMEVAASDPGHPIITEHGRLAKRIRAVLATTEGEP